MKIIYKPQGRALEDSTQNALDKKATQILLVILLICFILAICVYFYYRATGSF